MLKAKKFKYLATAYPSTKFTKPLQKICFFAVAFTFSYFVFLSTHISLPSKKQPVIFYASEHHDNFLLLHSHALKKAKRSIYLSIYALTDDRIIKLLQHKADLGLKVTIFYDPTGSKNLMQVFRDNVALFPVKSKGLMHKKILILDDKKIFLGSCNLTSSSLQMHSNTVIGLRNRALSSALQGKAFSYISADVGDQALQIWFLPNPKVANILIEHLQNAKKSIRVAMFTLTHPKIVEALIQAKKRGIDVQVAIDSHTAGGASKPAFQKLSEASIPVCSAGHHHLLHHKWAFIDEETVFLGSANWTRAAFSKNEDFICQIKNLSESQIKWFNKLWSSILLD